MPSLPFSFDNKNLSSDRRAKKNVTARGQEKSTRPDYFSPHEVAFLRALAAGNYYSKELADVLGIQPNTAKIYASRLMRKTGITSRTGLVVNAARLLSENTNTKTAS